LEDLGWGPFFQQQLNNEPPGGVVPGRIAEEMKGAYRVYAEPGPLTATVAGRLRHASITRERLPSVGDWVLVAPRKGEHTAVIRSVLARRTKLSRKAAGERTDEQILAANVDTVFVVAALNRDFNPRRVERYLAAVWEGGARPVVLLNKADICDEPYSLVRETESVAPGVPVCATSTVSGSGLGTVRAHVAPGETAAFVGSSGVGKSSLINAVLDAQGQSVRDIRADGKGRHTTTSRQLILLPSGGVVIDTPGLRELGLWDADAGLDRAFAEIDSLAAGCAFRDCRHIAEPGCAVLDAVDAGVLPEERFASYRKLERERGFMARRQDKALEIAEKKRWKRIHLDNRQRMRFRGR
jgi:ribosome biogenesis GTPase